MRLWSSKTISYLLLTVMLMGVSVLTFTACDSPDPTGPAASARIHLTATESEIPADGAATVLITAYVDDPEGKPADGPIYWTSTCGILDKSSETMSGGVSSVTLQAPNYPCTAVVTADAIHAKATIEIICYSVDAYSITVTSNPFEIPADGYSTSTISAVVKDERGLYVPDGTEVLFSTTGGTLSSDSATTASGRATVLVTSETVPKNAKITASVGSTSASAWVRFYSTQVGWIILQANPDDGIPADGASYSIITARVYDVNGNLVEDGTTIYFTTTWGYLSSSSVSTVKGIATVYLHSNYSTSNAIAEVIAVGGDKSESILIRFIGVDGTPRPTVTPHPTVTPSRTPTPAPTGVSTNTPIPPTATPSPTNTSSPPTFTYTPSPY